MRRIIEGVLVVLLVLGTFVLISSTSLGAPSLKYVYSDSMEPTIMVNDAFFVVPDNSIEIGDIIVYRPITLDAEFITHRVIGIDEEGFITQGDNSLAIDQDVGEPSVTNELIIGKVLEFNDKPIIIPMVGYVSSMFQEDTSNFMRIAALAFMLLGVLFLMLAKPNKYKRKRRRRWRLLKLYQIITWTTWVVVLFTIMIGSTAKQVTYLVTDSPGTQDSHILVGEEGSLSIYIENKGIVPVWSVLTGIDNIKTTNESILIWGKSIREEKIIIEETDQIGVYQGYVEVTNYPIVMPRYPITEAHHTSKFLGLFLEGFILTLWLFLGRLLLDSTPGFASEIPIKGYESKKTKRVFRKVRSYFFKNKRW